ncbi:hypothetical protein GAYE_HPESCF16G0217 [Galdieria yellowstonensis]|uniref:UDENN domain-containing protein n=1 Tax=Galdieria yellowstonensis TaxID=3028027 RepID=A0AAV9I4N1_9RHOD|nr:hypothetical protein GAYE_HPESCF16G0217 [Galdieria yellowstonensis]
MFPLLGFVWVEFDVENGPCVRDTFCSQGDDVESFQASELFSTAAKDFIAFHAMPDSTSFSSEISKLEDSLFFFHVPCTLLYETELASKFWKNNGPCTSKFCYETVEPVAHSLFRVSVSKSAPRGYNQSAVVAVCTTSMSISFVRTLLYIVADKLFQNGTLCRNQVEQELRSMRFQWLQIITEEKDAQSISKRTLKFLDSHLVVTGDYISCPCGSTRRWCIHTVNVSQGELSSYESMKTRDFPITSLVKPNCTVPFFHEFDLYLCFSENLSYLWTLWELMMLGEPVLVVSSTPARACSAVGCLLSLLVPLLPVSLNWQSYFVIQDLEENRPANSNNNNNYYLFGITNAFLCRQWKQAKHILFIGQPVDRHSEMYPALYLKTKYSRKFRENKRFLKALKNCSQGLAACVVLREYFREMTLTVLRLFHSFFVPLNVQEMKQNTERIGRNDNDDLVNIFMQSPPAFRFLDKTTFPTDHDIEASCIMNLLSSKRDALVNKFLLDKKHLFYSSLNDHVSESDSSDEEEDSETEESIQLSRNLDSLQLHPRNKAAASHSRRKSDGSDDVHSKSSSIRRKLYAASRHRKLNKRKSVVRQFVKDFMNSPVFEEWFHKQSSQSEYRWFIRYKQYMTALLSKLETLQGRRWQLPNRWRNKIEAHVDYVRQMGDSEMECRLLNIFTSWNQLANTAKE